MKEEKVVANSARLGQALSDRLAGFVSEHPDLASETRGRGLLQALVLRDAERAATIPARAAEKGVLVNVTAGNVVRFFPALNIPDDELFDATETVFDLVREG